MFTIPNDLLVGIYLTVPIDLQINPMSCFISKIVYTPTILTLTISGTVAGGVAELMRADISLVSAQQQINAHEAAVAFFVGVGLYTDLRGRVLLNRLDNLKLQPVGSYSFDTAGAGIEVDCVRPQIRHVSAVEVETNPGQFTRLTGPIRLRSGQNARFRVESENNVPVIYLDAVNAADLNDQLQCEEGTSPPIRRINGIGGNSQREVLIDGSRCFEITALENALQMKNPCSEPCAGCAETEALEQIVTPVVTQLPALTAFIARLQASVDQQSQAIALSQGPLQCNTGS